ncbi:MAG: molecular chaperone [Candidatus Promineifilaceae bacterium]
MRAFENVLPAADLALARRRTYTLFGRLFLAGLSEGLLGPLEAVPELLELALPFDADAAAADHYQLTAVLVFPYESIFLDPVGLLGGEISEQLALTYRRHGYPVTSEADHLGHELLYMGRLCAGEASAYASGDGAAASLWHSRQRAFLVAHLLTWLPPLVLAVAGGELRFYERLAELTLALAGDHLGARDVKDPFHLPDPPPLAGDETGIKEIARYLVTPPYSGLFLSREAIAAVARGQQLPRGFGDRAQLLANLLRAGGQYDSAELVLDNLGRTFAAGATAYSAQQETYPEIAPWIEPWRERASRTAARLADLASQVPAQS